MYVFIFVSIKQMVKFPKRLNYSNSSTVWETSPFVVVVYGKVSQQVKLKSSTFWETLPYMNKTNGTASQGNFTIHEENKWCSCPKS